MNHRLRLKYQEACSRDVKAYNKHSPFRSFWQVHILPREMLGRSTFGLSMWLLKWLPIKMVDRFLLLASHLLIGDTGRLGIDRPQVGPLELKNLSGKTPVLDVGTLAKIRAGDIKVCSLCHHFLLSFYVICILLHHSFVVVVIGMVVDMAGVAGH